MAVSVSNVDLMERLCHLTNKIYREMLYIRRHERMTYITVRGLDQVPVGAFSSTMHYKLVLSRDLLDWITVEDGIPCSFTNFITSPELSGPLYIRPDIYHTQITEYFLLVSFFSLNRTSLLIIILLDPPINFPSRMRACGNTFPVLFRLK